MAYPTLRKGSRGKDVITLQDDLVKLGYSLGKVDGVFGSKTEEAVIKFQVDHKLKDDGIVGNLTWAAINNALKPPKPIIQYLNPKDYPDIKDLEMLKAVNLDLQDETPLRIKLVQEALHWAFPHGFYISGGNLYGSNLLPNIMTMAKLKESERISPSFFTGGRAKFMEDFLIANPAPFQIVGADCSGMEVGLWRKFGLVEPHFDASADTIYRHYCYSLKKEELRAGDCVFIASAGRIPHTGMYLGAGYTIEFAGGAYGCAISKLDSHYVMNQMTHKLQLKTTFTWYGRPKFLPI